MSGCVSETSSKDDDVHEVPSLELMTISSDMFTLDLYVLIFFLLFS